MKSLIDITEISDNIMHQFLDISELKHKDIDFYDYIFDVLTTSKYDDELPDFVVRLKPYLILNIMSNVYIYLVSRKHNKENGLGIRLIKVLSDKKISLFGLFDLFITNTAFANSLINYYFEATKNLEIEQEKRIIKLINDKKIEEILKLNPFIINKDLFKLSNKKFNQEEEVINFIINQYNDYYLNEMYDEYMPLENEKVAYEVMEILSELDEDVEEILEDYDEEDIEFYEIIKNNLVKEYKSDLRSVISYLMSNVYENLKIEEYDGEIYNPEREEILNFMEEEVSIDEINERFLTDCKFSYDVLCNFVNYNLGKRRKEYRKTRSKIKKIGGYPIIQKFNPYLGK